SAPRGGGQGSRLPLHEAPRGGYHPGPGDALHGGSDGPGGQLRDGVRQGADRGRWQPAVVGRDLRDGERFGQAHGAADRAAVPRDGVPHRGHRGHRAESPRMARKNDGRKTAAGGRKGAGAKPRAGPGVAKAAAKPAAKGAKGGKPVAAATPAPAKVKFRGRVLENEPLARYTTYR